MFSGKLLIPFDNHLNSVELLVQPDRNGEKSQCSPKDKVAYESDSGRPFRSKHVGDLGTAKFGGFEKVS